MIQKEIKKHKRGNSYGYRVYITKEDFNDLDKSNDIIIINCKEYRKIQSKLNEYDSLKKEIESIKKTLEHQTETSLKLDQQHHDQLKQSYNQFNNDLKKYIAVNQLQNTALKQILELGFIDMIMNKHKKIAKNQIKELKKDKKVYELTPNIKEW